jgi:hypothetical protein
MNKGPRLFDLIPFVRFELKREPELAVPHCLSKPCDRAALTSSTIAS